HPFLAPSASAAAAASTATVTTLALSSFSISLFRRGRLAFPDDGQVKIAVGIDDQFFDPGQDLFHGLDIEPLTGDLRRFVVFGGDLGEAGGVAGSLVDLAFLEGGSLLEQFLGFTAGLGNHVIGIALGLVDDTGGIGLGAGHIAEGVRRFGWGADAFDVDGGETDAGAVVVDSLLSGGQDFVLDGDFFGSEDSIDVAV